MSELRQLLFRMEEVDAGYRIEAQVVDGVGGPWHTVLTETDLPVVPALADADERQVLALGAQLHKMLSGAELASAWRSGFDRIVFDVRCDRLGNLPWELVVDADDDTPFAKAERPAVRGSLPYPRQPAELAVPIQVLVVVGDPNDPDLDAQAEIDAVYRGLRGSPCSWHVDVLSGPSRQDLRLAVRDLRPQVLHFIGHGAVFGGNWALKVVSTNEVWGLDAKFVARAVDDELDLRLVVLNACRTAGESSGVRGVADGFAKKAAAVVSTQGDITAAGAAVFTERLYEELACGRAVDVTVAAARRHLQFEERLPAATWGLPVLTLAADPSLVLRHTKHWALDDAISRYQEFRDIPRLVDRSADRRRMHREVGQASTRLLFVTGMPKAGKSMVLRAYALTELVGGGPVVYVSLEGRGYVSTPDFVRRMVEEVGRWLGDPATSLCADTLDALSGRVSGPISLSARPSGTLAAVDSNYQKFQGLLANLARIQPLVLVLDNVADQVPRQDLLDGLLRPAAEGKLCDVQVVVAGGKDDLRALTGGQDIVPREIEVRPFSKRDATVLVREYLARSRPDGLTAEELVNWRRLCHAMLDWAHQRALMPNPTLRPAELISHGDDLLWEVGMR